MYCKATATVHTVVYTCRETTSASITKIMTTSTDTVPSPDLVVSSSSYLTGYDPLAITATACGTTSDHEEATRIFQTALFSWVDDYLARVSEIPPDTSFLSSLQQSIVRLWIEYAQFQKSLSLAIEAFEAAVSCPVAGTCVSLWKAYGLFLQGKHKLKAAQELYLRVLIGTTTTTSMTRDMLQQQPSVMNVSLSMEDRDILWKDFHSMIMTLRGEQVVTHSLQEFKATILYEHATSHSQIIHEDTTTAAAAAAATENDSTYTHGHHQAKASPISIPIPDASTVVQISKQLVQQVQIVTSDITAEWLARDGASLPTRPEPPLFSPSPPKWGDASGKDILGIDLSLQLIRLLLKNHEKDFVGTAILEIAKACWMMTALKEKEALLTLKQLDDSMVNDLQVLDQELQARLSVAGGDGSSTVSAVIQQQRNEMERRGFLEMCHQQRNQKLSYIAWDFRHVRFYIFFLF